MKVIPSVKEHSSSNWMINFGDGFMEDMIVKVEDGCKGLQNLNGKKQILLQFFD